MNSQYLTIGQIAILETLQARANEKLAKLLENAIKGTLSIDNVQAVCQALNDEYLMRGIKENYSANEYGEELESLLDEINRPRILSHDIQIQRLAGE